MINGIERVGIYGGTFSPIHNGHIAAAKAFFEQMKLDRLIIIPALIPINMIKEVINLYFLCICTPFKLYKSL